MTPRKFTNEQENEIAQEYLEGKTYSYLKEKYGCSLFTINALLRRQGVVPRGCGDHGRIHTAQEEDEIIDIYLSSCNTAESLAVTYGYTQSGFSRLLKRRGVIPIRRHMSDEIDKTDVIRRYSKGETIQGIADSYYVSSTVIKNILMVSGVSLRGKNKHGLSGTKRYNNHRARKRLERNKLLDTSWMLYMEVCLYDRFDACVICGTRTKLHTDHLLPLSLGYGLFIDNVVVLCESCNSSKSGKYITELSPKIRRKLIDASCEFQDYFDQTLFGEI